MTTRRKTACLLLCVLLLFLLSASVTRQARPSEAVEVQSISADLLFEEIPGSSAPDMRAEASANGVTFSAVGNDPHLRLPRQDGVDAITLTLKEPPQAVPTLTLRAENDSGVRGTLQPVEKTENDGGSVSYLFRLPQQPDADRYELRFGSTFTLISVKEAFTPPTGTAYQPNFPVLLLLLLLTVGLFLFEKRLRFFKTMREIANQEFSKRMFLSLKKRILSIISLVCILAFWLTAFLDLALSLTLPAASLLLFVLAVLSVIATLTRGLYLFPKTSYARIFLAVAATLGVALILALPPSLHLSWDDEFHFAYMISPAGFLTGGDIPYSAQSLIVASPSPTSVLNDTEGFAETLLRLDAFSAPIGTLGLPDLHPVLYVLAAPFLAVYAAFRYLVYLPGILVSLFGIAFGTDIIFLLSLARLANFALAVTVMFFALRRLRYGRHLFALCALLPTALLLSANFSCDPFINAFIALAFAYFIGELQRPNEPLTGKNAAIMLGALTLGCGPKAVYFVLFLPFFFLPKSKFRDKKAARRFRCITGGIAAAVALTILLPMLINSGAYSDLRGGTDVSAWGQIRSILAAPFAYLGILFRFLGDAFSATHVAPYIVTLSYLYAGSAFLGSLFLLLLLLVAVCDRTREDGFDLSSRPIPKLTSLLSVLAAAMLVATALYVSFTPVGADTVLGCQFRYFFPLFPIFLYFIGSVRLRSFVSERALTLLSLGGGAFFSLLLFFEGVLL